MTSRLRGFFMLLFLMIATAVSAKFLQEVELYDGTVLVGYVYRQQPGKFMVFYANRPKNDPNGMYKQHDEYYTIQWKDVKFIRRSTESEWPWCYDKVTLKNGTSYVGHIEEQELGASMTIRLKNEIKKVKVNNGELETFEKVAADTSKDLWADRQYTNRLKLTDNSNREGLIVKQYRGSTITECYVELLHGSGYKERIYLPDIKEFVFLLQ